MGLAPGFNFSALSNVSNTNLLLFELLNTYEIIDFSYKSIMADKYNFLF